MPIKRQIPLLIDHHTHTSVYATLNGCVDLSGVSTQDQALSLINAREEEVTIAHGWNNSLFSFDQRDIDRCGVLIVCNVSFHDFILNTPAKDRFRSSNPMLVDHIDDPEWIDNNLPGILKFLVDIKPCRNEEVTAFNDKLLAQGIWATEDMLLPNPRVYTQFKALGFQQRTTFWCDPETYAALDTETQKAVRGIKLFADGALGSRTAALKSPFLSGENGLLLYKNADLKNRLEKIMLLDKPVSIHALGDLATDQVIHVIDQIQQERKSALPRIRLEHCQFISEAMAVKAHSLGLILGMQPNFNDDSLQYKDRLPEAYSVMNNPFRMLIDRVGFIPGKDLLLGSDGMPHGVQFALQMALFPPVSSQRLSLDEFTAGYCIDSMDPGHIDLVIDEEEKTIHCSVITRETHL